jgi:hypothetical protein
VEAVYDYTVCMSVFWVLRGFMNVCSTLDVFPTEAATILGVHDRKLQLTVCVYWVETQSIAVSDEEVLGHRQSIHLGHLRVSKVKLFGLGVFIRLSDIGNVA